LLGIGVGTVSKLYGYHRRGLEGDPSYLTIVGELVRQSLESCFGPRVAGMAHALADSHLSRSGAKNA
jgi:hypothetical protein